MLGYRDQLVNDIKSYSQSEGITDREAFFNLYLQLLEDGDFIEDYHYLFFEGVGNYNRRIQIDGYAYNELDSKLTLFIMPPLAYYENKTLTFSETENYFKRAKYFFTDAKKVVENAEESSEGFGLAFDIFKKIMKIELLELVIITDLQKSQRIDVIPSDYESTVRIDYSIYDISRKKQIESSEQGKEAIIIKLKDDFDCQGIPALPASKTEEYQAYLCNVPGVVLAKMYDKFQSRLLEGNVRSFLQTRGKVNKGIRNTILNEPEMFFAYNNGIAATAEELVLENSENGLVITSFKGLQIVNGGQTTASLANAWINDRRHNSQEKIESIFVPMKVSVVNYENSQELIPNISRFANSQNRVSDSDLASNHPFHVKIEELSRRISAPAVNGAQFGTYWYYERANGQYRQETYKATPSVKKKFEALNPRNQLFKKTDLAKYYNLYLEKPHSASAGAQKSFSIFSSWMIKRWNNNENFVNERFFRRVVSLAILHKKSDYIVRNAVWYDSYKANIVAYTLSAIFHKVRVDYSEYTIDFQKIWKEQDLSRAWVRQIQTVSELMYKHLTDPNRTVENVTEWAKRQTSWEMAKQIPFELSNDFIYELSIKKIVESDRAYAVKEEKSFKEMDALIKVFEYGTDFWKEVLQWGEQEKIWNIQDKSFLEVAINMEKKPPSDKQSIRILQVLDKARFESFPK